jgi:hypothetical protein
MFKTRSILNEMQSLISRYDFEKVVFEEKSDKNIRNFSSWEMLKVMLFSQFAKKISLRDIETSLRSRMKNWYHLGIRALSRNNLSNALKHRSAMLFEKTFYMLLDRMMKEGYYRKDKRFKTSRKLTAIDSTTIPLCLKVFEWAKFRKAKGGIKLHTMYNIRNQVPEFIVLSNAKQHDVTPIKEMKFQKGSVYVMDKAYFSIRVFKKLNEIGAFFITRTKVNTKYRVIRRRILGGINKIEDLIVDFRDQKKKIYPERLRIVRFTDIKTGKEYEFITNNATMKAEDIASIYKARWDIELFFKHIKQNLKIKKFLGTSENAVRIQIWAAMIALLLVEFIRFVSKTIFSSTEILRIFGENLFSEKSIMRLLKAEKYQPLELRRSSFDLQLTLAW